MHRPSFPHHDCCWTKQGEESEEQKQKEQQQEHPPSFPHRDCYWTEQEQGERSEEQQQQQEHRPNFRPWWSWEQWQADSNQTGEWKKSWKRNWKDYHGGVQDVKTADTE